MRQTFKALAVEARRFARTATRPITRRIAHVRAAWRVCRLAGLTRSQAIRYALRCFDPAQA
jgi:hypothetical protein